MENIVINLEDVTKVFKVNPPKTNMNKEKDLQQRSTTHKNNLVALDRISFNVSKGEVLGIIGLNGSGKTTLLRIISGIYLPDAGSVNVSGRLAPLLQIGTGFHGELVARENIVMYGLLLGFTKEEIEKKVEKIVRFAEMEEYSNMKLKHYSTGMRLRLAFSTALEVDPDILLVDEILAVGDITFRKKSFNAFLSFKNNKKTIIYSSHNLDVISKLCDRVLLLHRGKSQMIGRPEEVISKYNEIQHGENKKP